jgi:hypothetical protein
MNNIKGIEEDESTEFNNLQNAGLDILIVLHIFVILQLKCKAISVTGREGS